MKAVKKKSRKKSLFLRFALVAFSIYILASLYTLQKSIKEKERASEEIKRQVAEMEGIVGELDQRNDNDEQNLEQGAYEQGYAHENDEIYKIR